MKRIGLVLALALGAFALPACGKKKEAPPTAGSAPATGSAVAVAPPDMGSAGSAAGSGAAGSAAAAVEAEVEVPTEVDFETEAAAKITEKTVEAELKAVEQELGQ